MTMEQTRDHVDFVSAHPARSFRGSESALCDRSVTCFQLVKGVFQKGISLNPDSSFQGRPALFVGEHRYVMISDFAPATVDKDNVLRVASIRRGGPDQKVPLLSQRQSSDDTALVYVDTAFERHPGTIFKEPFSSKIIPGGTVIAYEKNEMLVMLAPGESIEILYADGAVRQVTYKDGEVTSTPLSLEHQAAHRICYLNGQLDHFRKELTGDNLVRATDKIFHEFVAIMRVGGNRSQDVFKMAYSRLEDAGQKGELGGGVFQHACQVLEEQRRTEYLLRFRFTSAKRATASSQQSVPASAAPKPLGKGGVPLARRQQLADRAQRDRDLRSAARGKTGEKPAKAGSKKSKK